MLQMRRLFRTTCNIEVKRTRLLGGYRAGRRGIADWTSICQSLVDQGAVTVATAAAATPAI